MNSTDALFVAMGTRTPASRFRVQQFLPYLESEGVTTTLLTGYGDGYNVHASRRYAPLYKLLGRGKRAVGTALRAPDHDVVFLQRPALPFTSLPERLAARGNPRIIFDFDDAIFLNGDGVPAGRTYRGFMDAVRLSRHVLAGNAYLAAHTLAPEKTTVLPTVIDTERYRPRTPSVREERVVIGWMGTASNFHQLHRIVPQLSRVLQARPEVRIRIVSNAFFEPLGGHSGVEQVPWSAERELALLQSFDIGLMPLDDTSWSRGKCGFKLIQYMATGNPVVASAVGANNEIVLDAVSGYLVEAENAWTDALISLVDSSDQRHEMGMEARQHVEKSYSINSVLPALLDVIHRVGRGEGTS